MKKTENILQRSLREFSEMPPLFKVAFLLLAIVNITSIGSLADQVYEFKSFILEDLVRYYRIATEPVINLANAIGLSLRRNQLDSLVALSLAYRPLFTKESLFILLSSGLVGILMIIGFAVWAVWEGDPSINLLLISMPFFMLISLLIFAPFMKDEVDPFTFERLEWSSEILKFLGHYWAVLLFAVIASIIEGLARAI